MSKNLTRKGLAFGAIVALGTTLFAGAPATAAGIDNGNVSLATNGGAEYDTIAGATFDLKSNFANAAKTTGAYLKFQVEDASAKSSVVAAGSSQYTYAASAYSQLASNEKATLTVSAGHKFKVGDEVAVTGFDDTSYDTGDGTVTAAVTTNGVDTSATEVFTLTFADNFKVGDIITVNNVATAAVAVTLNETSAASVTAAALAVKNAVVAAAGALYTGTVNAGVATFTAIDDLASLTNATAAKTVTAVDPTKVNTTRATITDITATSVSYIGSAIALSASTTTDVGSIALIASTPATGKYIFDTKDDTNLADKTLRLDSTDEDSTQTVTVTAWIDNNDNGVIDTAEYQSPARTVRFLKHSDVTASVVYSPIAVGSDSTVVAKVSFTPVLNGVQLNRDLGSDAAAVVANFTRPGSSATLRSASTVYSNTTKQWTITSVDMNASSGDDLELDNVQTTGWNIAQPTGSLLPQSVKIVKEVVTVTTSTTNYAAGSVADHGLQVGDIVTVASATSTGANVTTKAITSVPSTSTFTYAAAAGTADLAAATQSAGTITVTKILRNFAVAGTYTAQVLLYKDSANALTKLGSAVSSTGVAVSASSATIESVSSATVSGTVSSAASVFTGTKTAAFVGKVLDVDGAAVGAGLDAVITATAVTSVGTVKINGTTVVAGTVLYAKTDASGQVAISVENSSALAGESVVLDLDIQGVDAADVTASWADKVYSIVDLNDPSAVTSPARTRAVADGASYAFNLQVQDQFKAVAGTDIRLKAVIAGRSSSTQIVPLTAGKATLTVADAGLAATGDTTVALTFQKLTSGVWADAADTATYQDWNGAVGAEDEATVAIKYYTQTDALALNANAANLPSSITADFAAATTTKSLVAVDSRVSNTAATSVVVAGKAVVSGAVTNATTGAAKSGQVVTVSGAGLLFKSGDVWTIGSASQIAADGTFAFEVYSNNPGTKVVTVTSGSLTKTASLVFTGASSAVRTLTVSGTQKVLPGSTLQANILLVDGNGNAVDTTAPATTPASEYISVSYEGPGLLSGSALPAETDKDGKASVRYLLGTGDRGVATVTVKFDANYDGDFVDATDITVVREYLIGVSAKIVKAKNSVATVKNASGASITVVRGTKSKTVIATSNSQKVTVKGGTGTVKVYVNDIKVASK